MKSIVVNVPGTYPPEKINGAMITGLLTPSRDSNFTYPKDIKERLTKGDLGEYELEQFWLVDFSRSRMKKRAPENVAPMSFNLFFGTDTFPFTLNTESNGDSCLQQNV